MGYWLARTYARGARPDPGLTFDATRLPKQRPLPKQTVEQLQQLDFFGQNPGADEGVSGASLSARLFVQRLELIAELDERAKAENAAPSLNTCAIATGTATP